MLKKEIENIFFFADKWEIKRNAHIGIINKIISVLIRKPNPKNAEENIKSML